MKIKVMHNFDTVEAVDASNLKRLIADKKILAFQRSCGWVKIGDDPIRGCGGADYNGPERRNVVQKPLSEAQKSKQFRCVLGRIGTFFE